MSFDRKKVHDRVEEIHDEFFPEGEIEYVDEERHSNSLGLTHTNISIVHVADDVTVAELTAFRGRLEEEDYMTSLDENQEGNVVVNVMYSYDVVENLGLD